MIPAVVRAAVAAATQGADAEVTMRAREVHQSNALFDVWVDGRHLIAKHYLKPDEQEDAPAREYASLQRVARLDVAPRPMFYDATVGPVVVYAFLDGRMWGRYLPTPTELAALATMMARLHALPTDGLWVARGSEIGPAAQVAWFREILGKYVAWASEHFAPGLAAARVCEPLIEAAGVMVHELARTMPQQVFCKSDMRFANVIARPDGRLAFVDWEDAGLRDPALELADLLLHPEQEDLLTEGDYAALLGRYCDVTGVRQGEFSQRVAAYCRVLPIFWVLIMLRYGVGMAVEGRLAAWQSNGVPARQRLLRYFARAQAGSMWDVDVDACAEVRFFPAT